jgi:tetratricopeptide (TPR) repeat protein
MYKSALLLLFTLTLFAQENPKCDKCFIGKEYMRCSYYVEKNADLSKQATCITYANSLLKGESPGRASWYYIVGGDFDKAIEAGEKALQRKEFFALEHLAEAYLLKGDIKRAKTYFSKMRKKSLQNQAFIEKHFAILSKLYPQNFDSSKLQ